MLGLLQVVFISTESLYERDLITFLLNISIFLQVQNIRHDVDNTAKSHERTSHVFGLRSLLEAFQVLRSAEEWQLQGNVPWQSEADCFFTAQGMFSLLLLSDLSLGFT